MTKNDMLKRYFLLIWGLFFNSLGVSLVTIAGLGSPPISSLPYVFSVKFPLTLGQFTVLLNVIMLIGQILILKKDFKKIQFLQIPILFIFGLFIDLNMYVFSFLDSAHYGMKIVVLLLGCLSFGLGICIQIIANVVMLSADGLVRAIAFKSKKEFGAVKTTFDISLVTLAFLLSFVFLGRIEGIREGTLITAMTVGYFTTLFKKLFGTLSKTLSNIKIHKDVSERI